MIPTELSQRYQQINSNCHTRLTGQPRLSMREQLAAITEQSDQYAQQDVYGSGELIESFEADIAELLGKEAAVFLPSGTMAQAIALRIWSEHNGSPYVGFHATSHLELHESKAYQALHGLHGILLGDRNSVITLADLEAVTDPLAAVLLELPMREIGGQLPSWEELQSQSAWAREQGIALHMDGARLWQCTPYYERTLAEIAALFDSVYLSFYKDMGGIAGSTLAGSEEFIQAAKTWIRRAGGNLYSLFPYVLAARAGMERNLAAMPAAVDAATWLARFLNSIEGLETLPTVPPTNLFHLLVPGNPADLVEHACNWSEQHGVFLLPMPRASLGSRCICEFSIGQAINAEPRERWQAWIEDFFLSR
ncbi:MAG: beta-eliminating lyase-related protein [Marinobacter sp.]|uniref:threonine aldolase family protein n=1 Tax=Marinobacter sp. TaxID=50741 RepID=UPI0032980D9D